MCVCVCVGACLCVCSHRHSDADSAFIGKITLIPQLMTPKSMSTKIIGSTSKHVTLRRIKDF